MPNPVKVYRFIRNYYHDYLDSLPYNIKLFNYQWNNRHIQDHWLYQFIVKRGIINPNSKKTLSIFSVNGEKLAIKINLSKYKIFYTVENVHVPCSYWQKYEDLLLDDKSIALSLGFDYLNHERYLRFPYWMMTNFKPEADYESIKQTCAQLEKHKIDANRRSKFCSLVCKSDYFGTRKVFYDLISQVGYIDCDGRFMNNNDDLIVQYNNNKREYLTNYKFNLCPENSDHKGYVTEKIFDAIYSGCIPIYWGSENNPEPEILNHNAICFMEEKGNNDSVIKLLKKLNDNHKLYKEFAEQNRIKKNAHEIIYDSFINLETKLKKVLNN